MTPVNKLSVGQIPVGNILLLVTALLGGWLAQNRSPLDSRRPELEARAVQQAGSKVVSRLWEDPFEVLERWKEEQAGGAAVPGSMATILSKKSNTLVVPVIMDPAHYPETRESRIQQRYAVLAALNASGYERENANVMGVGILQLEGRDLPIPYEWFSKGRMLADALTDTPLSGVAPVFEQPGCMSNRFQHVCLLWLEDDFLKTKTAAILEPGQGPLSDYRQLTELLMREMNAEDQKRSEVRMVGPRGSDDLWRILQEIDRLRDGSEYFTHRAKLTEKHIQALTAIQLLSDVDIPIEQAASRLKVRQDSGAREKKRLEKQCRKQDVSIKWSDVGDESEMRSKNAKEIISNYCVVVQADGEYAQAKESLKHLLGQLKQAEGTLQEYRRRLQGLNVRERVLRDEAEVRSPDESDALAQERYRVERQLFGVETKRDYYLEVIQAVAAVYCDGALRRDGRMDLTELESVLNEDPSEGKSDVDRLYYDRLIKKSREKIEKKWLQRSANLRWLADKDRSFQEAFRLLGMAAADHRIATEQAAVKDRIVSAGKARRVTLIQKLDEQILEYQRLGGAIVERAENKARDHLPMAGVLDNPVRIPTCSVFSPWATADYKLLGLASGNGELHSLLKKSDEDREEKELEELKDIRQELLRFHGIHFNRTILRDSNVVKALLKELDLRGALPKPISGGPADEQPEEGIVLVGEWDSLFSRALSLGFALEYTEMKNGRTDGAWPENVHVFNYLRGLDGLLPGKKHVQAPEGNAAAKESVKTRYPDGNSQYDYLRRMSDRITRMERAGTKIKAVGIFGSDPYDKLLILRALRKSLPDAVFFTTDLDARFSHPSELEWTRGLVVGSSYGLELHRDLQKGTPPFRNAYQTAIYATMLPLLKGDAWAFNIDQHQPRIFEIGYNGPYDLSPGQKSMDVFTQLHPDNMNLWHQHKNGVRLGVGFVLFLPVILLFISGILAAARSNPGMKRAGRIWCGFLAVGLLAGGWMLWVMQRSVTGRAGEPLSFTEGISIWPSLIIRMLVFIVSVYCILRSYFAIRGDRLRIPRLFDLGRASDERSCWSYFGWPFSGRHHPGTMAELWQAYSCRRHVGWCYAGLFGLSLVYGFLASKVVRLIPPFTPYRGGVALTAHGVTLVLSLLAMVLLCAVTISALLRCARFIGSIYARKNGLLCPGCWKPGMAPALVHLQNVLLVGRVTETTGRIVIYPFIALLLMIFSRYGIIDRWSWPIPLVGVIGLTVLGSLTAAVYMWHKARQVKVLALGELRAMQLQQDDDPAVGLYIDEIKACSLGAFAPLGSNPILLAVLTPFGGIGAISIIQNAMSML